MSSPLVALLGVFDSSLVLNASEALIALEGLVFPSGSSIGEEFATPLFLGPFSNYISSFFDLNFSSGNLMIPNFLSLSVTVYYLRLLAVTP